MEWCHGTNAAFSEFKVNGFGVHVGTLEQALPAPRGNTLIKRLDIKVKHPLRLPDLYSWDAFDIAEQLEDKLDVSLDNLKLNICQAQGSESHDAGFYYTLHNVIKRHHYDAVIYSNKWEGEGDSLIIFDTSLITVLSTLPRQHYLART